MAKQVTIRFHGDTYQRMAYLRREVRKKQRRKVSMQSIISDVLIAGLNALRVPKFPGEVDEDPDLS